MRKRKQVYDTHSKANVAPVSEKIKYFVIRIVKDMKLGYKINFATKVGTSVAVTLPKRSTYSKGCGVRIRNCLTP
jgi:hypothetical protein